MKDIQSLFFKTLVVIATVFICLYAFTKLLGPIPFSVNSIQTTKSDLFSATGTGEAKGTPSTARIMLGVTKTAATADEAKNEANKIINAVTNELKSIGIDEKKIKTVNFSVNPDFSVIEPLTTTTRPAVAPQTQRFTATANLDVEAKDVETANRAVDVASQNGANLIGGVSFDLSDEEREKLEDQAREMAIKDARENAEKIAKAAGIRLGKVVNISESGGIPPYISARAAELKQDAVSEPTDLQPGENTVTISVTLFYETL